MPAANHDDPADLFNVALIQRLRAMHWPAPEPDVRQRCLERIQSRIARDPGRIPARGSLPNGMVNEFSALPPRRHDAA